MASNALANASKTVQDQAKGLARSAAAKAAKNVKSGMKVKTTGLGALGAVALGIAERFMGGAQLGPIDNGLTVGLPLALVGAFAPGKAGEYIMMVGNGPLFAGLRETAKSLGADAAATAGEFDNVM